MSSSFLNLGRVQGLSPIWVSRNIFVAWSLSRIALSAEILEVGSCSFSGICGFPEPALLEKIGALQYKQLPSHLLFSLALLRFLKPWGFIFIFVL